MSKSIFGWSYPPGCSGPPDGDDCISPESENAWNILEAAGIDDDVISQVVAIIDDLATRAAADCPRCMAIADAAEEAAWKAGEEYAVRPGSGRE